MNANKKNNKARSVEVCRSLRVAVCVGLATILCGPSHAESWLAVTPEELQMKSEPQAPAAAAIYLYRQVDRDDNASYENQYVRIKILTEEGRKYADVEIPYVKGSEIIRDLEARIIRPDGTAVEFDGTIYEKPIVKTRGAKLLAKTFTLPNVGVGTIIEYRYHHSLPDGYVFNSRWLLSADLYTKRAKFSLRPYERYALTWSWPKGLPAGTEDPKSVHGAIRLETHDVPAFVTEEYMPPADVLKYRVEFMYTWEGIPDKKDPAEFWKAYGKLRYSDVEDFIDKRKAMEEAVAEITQPGDTPEMKVRKIYARTQALRNVSFERDKSEQETRREKQKDARNVADILKSGYSDATDITWLFLALVRAAGVEAYPLLVATRDVYFFEPGYMNPHQLNSNAVLVRLDGKDLFLDPGTPFTPFGLLPWHETDVLALKLEKKTGTWVKVPRTDASDSRIERKVALKLEPGGSLVGKVTVTYTGLEALWRRLDERNEDETDRKEFLEEDVKEVIPSGIEVTLTNAPAWRSSEAPLVAEFDLKIPGWAASAGRRELLPVGLFSGAEKHTFEHATRVHPLYFNFPYQHADDITIDLPAGWQVASVPDPHVADLDRLSYNLVTQRGKDFLHINRKLSLNFALVDAKYYTLVRDFFQSVRTGDEQQVVLTAGAPRKGN